MVRILVAASIVALAGATPALAGAKEGEAIAGRWCADCHAAGAGQSDAKDTGPTFSDIADRRDDAWVKSFLARPHPPMPPLELSRRQIDDLAAYIRGQERPD